MVYKDGNDYMDVKYKRIYRIELCIIFICLLVMCGGHVIWYDESFSLMMMKQSFADIIRYTAMDVHPPAYYIILKLATMILTENFWVYHLVSVVPFMLMLVVIGKFIQQKYDYKAASIVVLLVTGAPEVLLYATEIRMYSWVMFVVVCSALLAYKIYETALAKESIKCLKMYFLFAIINVFAAYLHYFAGLAVILISLFLLFGILTIRDNRFKNFIYWLVGNLVTFILYLPWIFVFLKQFTEVRADYWIKGFRLSDLIDYTHFVFSDIEYLRIILLMLFGVTIFILLYSWKNKEEEVFILILGAIFCLYILVGVVISVLVSPVFVQRYIGIVLPLFWMAIGLIWIRQKEKNKYVVIGILSIFMFVVSYKGEFNHRVADYNMSLFYELDAEMEDDDYIINTSTHVMGQLGYYFPEKKQYILQEVINEEKFKEWNKVQNVEYINTYTELPKSNSNIWIVVYDDKNDIVEAMKNNGYDVKSEGEFALGYSGWPDDHMNLELYKCEYIGG